MPQLKKITDEKQLKRIANTIRINIIKSLVEAKSGHSAGPLGMADVFTALYFNVARHDPKNPWWTERDRIVLSNGHICPVWYATLAQAGYFPVDELKTLRKLNSRLQGHPHLGEPPGVENSGGPLAQGASLAIGKALAARLDKKKHRIYCLTSDGEHQEGQFMEAMMLAGNYKLDNLCFIVDRNNIQIDGDTEDVSPLEPLRAKYEAFKWHVLEVDGHNFHQIIDACEEAKTIHDQPTVIIAHTIPGKGVSFMENDYQWHGKPPTPEQAAVALKELEEIARQIEKE